MVLLLLLFAFGPGWLLVAVHDLPHGNPMSGQPIILTGITFEFALFTPALPGPVGTQDSYQLMVILLVFQEIINLCPVKNDGHTDIQPQDNQHDAGHAAINVGKAAKVTDVELCTY